MVMVTRTGPAASWADYSAMAEVMDDEGVPLVELVSSRCAVVLIVVDGTVPPVRSELDLVSAVSGATGRCAVGLAGSVTPGDSSWLAWRRAVDPSIPVGALDAAMVRTLVLLGEGPSHPLSPTPLEKRRDLLRKQLAGEQEFREAQLSEQPERPTASDDSHHLAEAMDQLSASITALGDAKTLSPRMLATATKRTGDRLAERLGLAEPLPCPTPKQLAKPSYGMEIAAGVLAFGASMGVGRMIVEPLELLGIGSAVAHGAAVVVGVLLAAVVAVGGGRRKAQHRKMAWAAQHVATVRKQWTRHIAVCRRSETTNSSTGMAHSQVGHGSGHARSPGWRERALTMALESNGN
ncbi:hypothetical protein [Corynebacterium sp. H113]|uniref:hypothetical protein n=1 Tax=Corynebacterium sp. H113 TaxID=3133419 RepID=UPI00309B0471